MAVEHKSVPTLGGSIKKTRAHEAAAPMSGEAVVSEIMRAYRTIDALTAENAAQMRSIGQVELAYQETLF